VTTALITGVTGQDGSYLAEFLLGKGYEVHGLARRSSSAARERLHDALSAYPESLHIWDGDLSEPLGLARVIDAVAPDEVYHLAAQSDVKVSFDMPDFTGDVTGVATMRLLEAMRLAAPDARFYQASSSEMFGSAEPPQTEQTPFHPRSPYGVAKVYSYWSTVNYRESYGLFASNGILFNHESPRRGPNFVTRKISQGVASIVHGRATDLRLGNLEAKRDWGFAGDYVEAMWLILQHDVPDDFVVATGESHSVREFCDLAFSHAGLDYRDFVVSDPKFFRPAEVDYLLGDPSKCKRELSWKPKTSFSELVRLMVDADLALT